jgi:CBS domain containing-hemolysin-like protein
LISKRAALLAALLGASLPANAAFLAGEALDTAADVLAWIVIVLVPIVAIVVFWLVHILPEKIAEHRHHPQQQAIKTLCLLSLVFGGMLWPIAWLWAYTRPVMYRMAYGTERHESYFEEGAARARAGTSTAEEIRHLREELEAMQARGVLPPGLRDLLGELKALHEQTRPPAAGEGAR